MTVTSPTSRVSYAGDGDTVAFPVSFKFLDNADLVVVLVDDATGAETPWSLGSQYLLTGAGSPGGGTLTVSTNPVDYMPQPGQTLIVYRDPDLTQGASLPLGGAFPSTVVERMADRLTMIAQRLSDVVSRSLRQPDGDTDAVAPFPSAVERASMLLGFDGAGAVALYGSSDTAAASAAQAATSAAAAAAAVDLLAVYTYTATGGETSKSGADDHAQTLSYVVGNILVMLNGVMLVSGTDYTATTGTSITGLAALAAGDVLTVVVLSTIGVESGSWTPVLAGSTVAGAHTYSTQLGTYALIGGLVYVKFNVALSAYDAACSGNMLITGLPFTSANDGVTSALSMSSVNGVVVLNSQNTIFALSVSPSQSRIGLSKRSILATGTGLALSNLEISSAPTFAGSGFYVTA
jgi:hypothetical protein